VTTLSEQIQALGAQALTRHPGNQAVADAVAELLAALNNNSAVGFIYQASDCKEWGRATAGAVDRASYRLFCQEWAAGLEQAQVDLEAALAGAGDLELAETVSAARDQTETALEQAEEVTDVSVGGLWSNTPGGLKAALGIAAALLVFRTVTR
jgi:hypothetical protein